MGRNAHLHAEVLVHRGGIVESRHRVQCAVVAAGGEPIAGAGAPGGAWAGTSGVTVVGVGGSVGKTSTKEAVASVVGSVRRVFRNPAPQCSSTESRKGLHYLDSRPTPTRSGLSTLQLMPDPRARH